MKKIYNVPELNLITVNLNDVITTSLGNDELGVSGSEIFKPAQQ